MNRSTIAYGLLLAVLTLPRPTQAEAYEMASFSNGEVPVRATTPLMSFSAPPDTVVACGTSLLPEATGQPAPPDNFCPDVTISYTDVAKDGACPVIATITRTWMATDECGNIAVASQFIEIQDLSGPTFLAPADLTIDCQSGLTDLSVTGIVSQVSDCSSIADTSYVDKVAGQSCAQAIVIERTWTLTDACGNATRAMQVITLPDPWPVSLQIPDAITISCEQDQDDELLTGSLQVSIGSCQAILPARYTDDISGLSGCNGTGQLRRIWLVDVHCPEAGEYTQLITVVDTTAPVAVAQNFHLDFTHSSQVEIMPEQIGEGSADLCGDITMTLSQSTFNCTDFINTQAYPVTLTVTDACGNSATTSANVTGTGALLAVEYPQQFVVQLTPGQCQTIISYGVSASGICGGPPQLMQTDGTGLTSGDAFPIGTTPQSYLAFNNTDTIVCAFSVSVLEHQGSSVMSCNDTIHVSVNEFCEAQIFSDMVLEGDHYGCYDDYLLDIAGVGSDTGVVVFPAQPYLNGYYSIMVTDPETGNYCTGTMLLEDKIAPQIFCACDPEDPEADTCVVSCLEVDLLESGIIPPHLYPQVIDNCEHTVTIADIDVDEAGCGEGTVIVTWLVTDSLSGASATCEQLFRIQPLAADSVVFPENYTGLCGSSSHPDTTGWPRIDGYDLTDQAGLCNLFLGYWDKPLDDCGGGAKILRTWTLLDWCTQELTEARQVIKLSDDAGPVLNCPADMTVGMDFWFCKASLTVPRPLAYDACTPIATYALEVSAGTIVQVGNSYVVKDLNLGTHTATWTVTDLCGNKSTCSFTITVIDNVAPVVNCDGHTVVALTTDGPDGITLVPASVFDDGSYDHCGPITFRARRMDSCIDVDWTTAGGCIDDIPNGIITGADLGTVFAPCVPFSCCDVPRTGSRAAPIMVQLEVTDAAGNVNYCMVEVDVQDKIPPVVECPPDISVSCDFWFAVQEGVYRDATGNKNGNLDEDPLSAIFGNMYDALSNNKDESVRQPIIINDPANTLFPQPYTWGLDGWSDDNCLSDLEVRVTVYDDCTGEDLPGNAPPGAIRLIERKFVLRDNGSGYNPAACIQRIWIVDFNPFYIADLDCANSDTQDGVKWPCDVLITSCPDELSNTGEPIIYADACSLIGVTYEDSRFDFSEGGACYKILRDWKVIDWCQYDPVTGEGLWTFTQVIKVLDDDAPIFISCPVQPVVACVADDGIRLPASNQAFLGENNPNASSCSVHVTFRQRVREACNEEVAYDVKIYPFNGDDFLQVLPRTIAQVSPDGEAELVFDSEVSPILDIRRNGLPYNSPWCGDYHKILWSVEDGCGNWSHCEYLFRLEDCKQPSPVCINGLSTVVMPSTCEVTLWASDFNASSFDDCTPASDLQYSFSGDVYEPSKTFNVTNIPAFGVELSIPIWVADGGTDDNCNGSVSWSERNKDFCITTIVFTDNSGNCDLSGSTVLEGEIMVGDDIPVEAVSVSLVRGGETVSGMMTADNGKYILALPQEIGTTYRISPSRMDFPGNGVTTLDLVRIQKHLLGRQPFTTPYQYIAADANNSQSVSALDLLEIRKLILGIQDEFPNSPSWRFVDEQFQFPNPGHPWPFAEFIEVPYSGSSVSHLDFTAVKVGDVNQTAQANAQQLWPRGVRRVIPVLLDAPEEVRPGELVRIRMTMPEVLSGFQWTLATTGLEFAGVSDDQSGIGSDHIGMPGHGWLTMSWHDPEPGSGKRTPLSFELLFHSTVGGSLSDLLTLSDAVTPTEAYTPEDEILDLQLISRADEEEQAFALYQNEPNPWTGSTVISFDLPEETDIILTVFDMSGKVLKIIEERRPAGHQRLSLSGQDIPGNGVLYYRLDAGPYSASKKMIRLE